ncbi:uncharacterized protein METZ01_LOCUS248871, partial [marine metagenome]
LAASGDTIKILPGLYKGFGENVHLDIYKSISIIGVNGADETTIDGEGSSYIFSISDNDGFEMKEVNIRAYFSGIKFIEGVATENSPYYGGGAIAANNLDSLIVVNSIFKNNRGFAADGGAVLINNSHALFKNVEFRDNSVYTNQVQGRSPSGGAVNIKLYDVETNGIKSAVFDHCTFDGNSVSIQHDNTNGSGGAVSLNGEINAIFRYSRFSDNGINIQGNDTYGWAAVLNHHVPTSNPPEVNWGEIGTTFEQSILTDNYMNPQGGNNSGPGTVLVDANVPINFFNCIVSDNYTVSNSQNQMSSLFWFNSNPDNNGDYAHYEFINNTFVENHDIGGLFSNGGNVTQDIINNIFWDNENPAFHGSTTSNTLLAHNILQDDSYFEAESVNNITGNPLFKNQAGGNYQLSKNSPAVDAGTINEHINVDYRGYYRQGIPDIGAFEAGASKYLL